jgi:hypothetical protein
MAGKRSRPSEESNAENASVSRSSTPEINNKMSLEELYKVSGLILYNNIAVG